MIHAVIAAAGLKALLLVPVAALAEAPALSLPVDCTLGETCFLQQTVDAEPGDAAADYRCGHLTYDGHKGSDFRIPPGAEVPVVAVADGRVLRLRDGEPDRVFARPLDVPENRGCGNGIIVDHGGGLSTQYCHLARGSVTVEPGRTVTRGEVLGKVGSSGIADFPHVELIVRREGEVLDPFTGLPPASGCGLALDPLWTEAALEAVEAVDRTQVVALGFHDGPVSIPMIEDLDTAAPGGGTMAPGAGALVAYALAMAVEKGDRHRIRLQGPGFDLDETQRIERDRAQSMRFVGRRLSDGLEPGTYTARVEILRDGVVLDAAEAVLTVR